MEEKGRIENMMHNIKEYAETRIDLGLLTFQDKATGVISSVASVFVVGILSVFFIFFASVGVAWMIGQSLQNPSIGFFIVAGFYLLVTAIILLNKDKWIGLPIINSLLKKININEEN